MKRDESVTIAKAIGIILMVIGHSGLGGYPTRLIYLFHMPLFFFLSGYCFKEYYLDRPKDYLLRRVKGAYWPYVKWSLLFLLFHNVFTYMHFYDNTLTIKETLVKALHISTGLWGNDQLLGGFWFLKSLFWSSIIFYGVKRICQFKYGFLFGGGSLLTFSMICNLMHIKVPYWGINETDLAASFFMLAGCEYHKHNIKVTSSCIFVGLLLMVIGTFLWSQQMIEMKWNTMIPYFFTAVLGSVLTLWLSRKIMDKNCFKSRKLLIFVGNNTLNILIWHFLCFKLVSFLIIHLYNLPIDSLAEFPVLKDYASQGWWMVYVVFGTGLPILFVLIKKIRFT